MSDKRLVWDLPLRLFHWLLLPSIAASWYTARNSEDFLMIGERVVGYTELHFCLGYGLLGMLVFRIVWGIVGPRHARFASFIPGFATLLAYVGTVLERDSRPSVGHNPMGAWMVVIMLLMIGAQAVTGLFLIDNTGTYAAPFHPSVTAATAGTLAGFHHINFNVLLWAIGLHVLAVLFYRYFKNQDLLGPMFTGRKAAGLVPADQAVSGSQLLKALIVVLLAASAVFLLLEFAPPPLEGYG